MISVTVRAVHPSEMDQTKAFIRRIFPEAVISVSEDDLLIVAEYNERLVGFAHIVDEGERIILQGLGVDESVRGHGVGTILLEHILQEYSDSEVPIFLKVKALNPAVELYTRYGFMMKKFGNVLVLVKKANC